MRYGGLLGFVGGFLLAYQRSSCKDSYDLSLRVFTEVIFSPLLGLVRELKGAGAGQGRNDGEGEAGTSDLRSLERA